MSAEPSRILIVDDDEATRHVKSRVLRGRGYAVSEASLGREALALAAAEKPHLTLLDVKLPDLSGIEVCREIKSRFPHVIVLQTSSAFTGSPTAPARSMAAPTPISSSRSSRMN
jgi:CheY-like chemotaxis protein